MALMKFITENASNSPYEKKYQDDEAIRDVIAYVCDPEKTGGCYIGGWAVDPCYAAYEMELLAKLFHNDQGVRLRHWTITFAEHELRRLEYRFRRDCMTMLYHLGAGFSAYYKDRYQILYAVHGGERPHLHFVMNTVSYVDGKKFSGSKADYYQYEKYAKRAAHALPPGSGHGCEAGTDAGNARAGKAGAVYAAHSLPAQRVLYHRNSLRRDLCWTYVRAVLKSRAGAYGGVRSERGTSR